MSEDYQQRVLEERKELRTRLFALQSWLKSDRSDVSDVALFLLREQAEAMVRYERILAARISLFGHELKDCARSEQEGK